MGAFFTIHATSNVGTYDTAYDQNKSRHFWYKVTILQQNLIDLWVKTTDPNYLKPYVYVSL